MFEIDEGTVELERIETDFGIFQAPERVHTATDGGDDPSANSTVGVPDCFVLDLQPPDPHQAVDLNSDSEGTLSIDWGWRKLRFRDLL